MTTWIKILSLLLSLLLSCGPLFSCESTNDAVPGGSSGTEDSGAGTEPPDWDALYPEKNDYVLTGEGLLEVGSERNVIVFLVDRFDMRYVNLVEEDQPGYFDQLKDFTYYDNNVSTYSRTYPAVAAMMSGVMRDFAPNSTAEAYFENAYQSSSLLTTLRKEGYAVRMYTADYYAYRNARVFRGLVDNIGVDGAEMYDTTGDASLYARLTTEGLSVGTDAKTFTFLHINGTHYPYQIDENGNAPADKGTPLGGALGSLKLVRTYIEQMKALGVYENSTIIITGDHPDPISDYNEPTRARPTALFVKRAGKSHEYEVSSAPLSDMDFMPSLLEEICPDRDFGTAYWEVAEDALRPRYHYFLLNSKPAGNESVTVYEVTGEAKDFDNWKRLYNKSINGRIYR